MKIEELKYETKIEVLHLIECNNIPEAVLIIHLELKCGLTAAKEMVESLRNQYK